MKKVIILILTIVYMISLSGCSNTTPQIVKTVEGNMKTYYEMSDDTWECEDYIYKYRLKITGRMNKAAKDSTFVYLSNVENITFDQAWKAAGYGSLASDYFNSEEAVLVEMY